MADENQQDLERAIAELTEHRRFGLKGQHRVDAAAWAETARKLGCDLAWVLSWIDRGYHTPPAWLKGDG